MPTASKLSVQLAPSRLPRHSSSDATFVTKAQFAGKPAEGQPIDKTDIRQVSDKTFLERATGNTLEIYQKVRASLSGPFLCGADRRRR